MIYEELVKALRCCDKYALCNDCPIFETCDGDVDKAMAIAADAIEALQAELPKRGEWVWKHRHHGWFKTAKGKCECGRDVYAQIDERYETDDPYCPFCGVMNDSIHLNYCPNCGAKMEVQE